MRSAILLGLLAIAETIAVTHGTTFSDKQRFVYMVIFLIIAAMDVWEFIARSILRR